MSRASRWAEIYRRIFYTVWALGTVLLVFVVALLVFVLLRQEHAPALPGFDQAAAAVPPPAEYFGETGEKRDITLYFADTRQLRLAPERASIEFTEFTTENCRNAIEALIRGPQSGLSPIVSPETRVRGVYLLPDGELVLDFSIDLALHAKKSVSASLEALMIYGIVNTVGQEALKGSREPAVATVRLLMEGSASEAFPVHADVSSPFAPDLRWTIGASE